MGMTILCEIFHDIPWEGSATLKTNDKYLGTLVEPSTHWHYTCINKNKLFCIWKVMHFRVCDPYIAKPK